MAQKNPQFFEGFFGQQPATFVINDLTINKHVLN